MNLRFPGRLTAGRYGTDTGMVYLSFNSRQCCTMGDRL